MKFPAKIEYQQITAIIDTREQLPLDLAPLRSEVGTLDTGDYSVKGLEHLIAIERKSPEDMLACIGRERERFDREIQRMLGYPARLIVVEAPWEFFCRGDWQSQVSVKAAKGSLVGWQIYGVPIHFATNREAAQEVVAWALWLEAKRIYEQIRGLTVEPKEALAKV